MARKFPNKITSQKNDSGFFLVLAPFLLIALMGFSTLVIDIGVMRVANSQLQIATDAAALAAANALPNGSSAAVDAAMDIAGRNEIIGHSTANNIQVQLGTWNTTTGTFTATIDSPTAARVTANASPPLFFTQLFTSNNYTVSSTSTAALIGGPRDIIFIVDLSPAMNFFSQLAAFPQLSQSTIEANLLAIYNAMGLPALGNMTWTPRLLIGTNTSIINSLGLQSVNYPFPSGSWTRYINYVKTDAALIATGYTNQYGYLTFVNYLLSQQPQYDETPTLWKTPQQPLQSVKDIISEFISQNTSTADRMGLVTYNRTNGNTAVVEQSLTSDASTVGSILIGNPATNTSGRQAAHYSRGSDILSSISQAIDELNTNGREGSQWIIYIFTAGQLTNSGIAAILNQAQSASNSNITINTITVSTSGNNALMQQIAQITGSDNSPPVPSTEVADSLGNMANLGGKARIVK